MGQSLSPELLLAAACCRWPADAEAEQRVRELAEHVTDWDRFGGIVRRNRIAPLVHRALTRTGIDVPPLLYGWLSQKARGAATLALHQAREALLIQNTLEAAGIPVLTVKGAPLALLAYGDLGIKESQDIDILVSPNDAAGARTILRAMGYVSDADTLTEGEFQRLLPHGREVAFHNPQTAMNVDLHWRLIEYRELLRGVDVEGPSQLVAVPGGMLRTLADGPTFAYLCLHGAFHNWSRLKWLADVGAFMSTRPEPEQEALCEAARHYSAGRSASVALSLCQQLLGSVPNLELQRSLEDSPTSRAITNAAMAGLVYRGGCAEQEPYSRPWWRALAARFFLAPGRAHVLEQARITWICPMDHARIPLPGFLSFLYHGLRVPLWVARICGRRLRRATA